MRTRIKICGLRDAQAALQVAKLGADAIGLVFYPPSPRHVSAEVAAEIAAERVGVGRLHRIFFDTLAKLVQ